MSRACFCISATLLFFVGLGFVSPLLAVPNAAVLTETAATATIQIRVDSPRPGEVVQNRIHQAQIRGSASASADAEPLAYDVIVAIDVSGSTKEPSGADVDRDGEVGFDPQAEFAPDGAYPPDLKCTDPGDTVLAAEVAAARALLGNLEPGRVRVGIVTFSGEANPQTNRRSRYDQQDALVEVPLTSDFDEARAALDGILVRGSHGATNFAAAIRLSITELVGLTEAKSRARKDVEKVVLFLSDGTPSFPFGLSYITDDGDIEVALSAARLAHKAGIRINTYAIGPLATTDPIAATEIARITEGSFMPVLNPGEIVAFLQAVSFVNVDDVLFTNLTTREISTDVKLSPDGSFTGFVPVREGTNRVRITALASDGTSNSIEFDMPFATDGLSSRELGVGLDRIRERNKELILLIERARIQRFRDQQRKALEIEIEIKEE